MSEPVFTSHQPSLTEWFAELGDATKAIALRDEDNTKAERLEILYQIIGLPYERPVILDATDLTNRTPVFAKMLQDRGDELCAIRLVPKTKDLPKLRNRGLTLRECYETWYLKQDIDPSRYWAHICPHPPGHLWSSIFVANSHGIFGEIIAGRHSQLTQGDTAAPAHQFFYDFKQWQWLHPDKQAEREAKRMIKRILVRDSKKQTAIHKKLSSSFEHDYLSGYFEANVWPDDQLYFIDYSRILGQHLSPPKFDNAPSKLKGVAAYAADYAGPVQIVDVSNLSSVSFPDGSVLVTRNTDVRFLPLMKRAGGIITEQGGLLSHAAIVARELKKPCVVGVTGALAVLKSGDHVHIAQSGQISIKA